MHNKEIVSQLQGGGGRPVVGHVLIKEGQTIDSIATTVGKNTKYSRQDFFEANERSKLYEESRKAIS